MTPKGPELVEGQTTHPKGPEQGAGPSAHANSDTHLRPGGPFRAIAHRGEPIGHRENTLPGIEAAVQAGADLVEIDVKVTADGQVVLLHDDTLLRLWSDPRRIIELDQDQLATIGDDRYRIPTLTEALEIIGRSGAALLIDMDTPTWAAPSRQVVADAVRQKLINADQVVWCGRPDALYEIRNAEAAARIIFSWDEGNGHGNLPPDSLIGDLAPEAFNPHWPMINDNVLAWIADHGLASCCWTVDDEPVMRELLARGVNAMITNRIHRLQELRPTDV